METGASAGLATLPWFGVTFWNASKALKRLTDGPSPELPRLCIEGSWLFLVIGSLWLTAARFGYPLLGFSEPIVSLTAVHFHYAGFAATRIVGLLGIEERRSALYPIPVLSVLTATPLVALGITFSPLLELAGSVLLAVGMLVLAWLLLQATSPLLKVAGLSLVLSMALACGYAVSEFAGLNWISIPTMVWSHGLLNAGGFATCSLIALKPVRHLSSLTSD